MNRTQRIQATRCGRKRAAVIAIVVSCAASSASAGTRDNPYFRVASSRTGDTVTETPVASDGSDIIDFEAINRMTLREGVAASASPSAAPVRVPRRLPHVSAESKRQHTLRQSRVRGDAHLTKTNSATQPKSTVTSDRITNSYISGSDTDSVGSQLGVPSTTSAQAEPTIGAVRVNPKRWNDTRMIAVAARRQAALSSRPVQSTDPVSNQWLQSITTESCTNRATKLLDDAYREYSVSAWASAEASAWKALELIATGIDVADRRTAETNASPTAAQELRDARRAIKEARDFVASGAAIDADQIDGIASSHQTPVLRQGISPSMTPTEAADRYLDYARTKLVPLAKIRVQAAQTMDLIAAVHLGRNDSNQLPEETSLCLRRAALQGQPSNGSLASRLGMQLADMGLDKEAQWTLNHAMSIQPSRDVAQTLARVMERRGDRDAAMRLTASLRQQMPNKPEAPRVPNVIQLSPSQFASISPAFNTGSGVTGAGNLSVPTQRPHPTVSLQQPGSVNSATPARLASARLNSSADPSPKATSRISRLIPASLTGFRLPFTKRSESPNDSETPEGLNIVDTNIDSENATPAAMIPGSSILPAESMTVGSQLDNGYSTGVYQPAEASPPTNSKSRLNRILGIVPKLW